jgi:hypothetical protein
MVVGALEAEQSSISNYVNSNSKGAYTQEASNNSDFNISAK